MSRRVITTLVNYSVAQENNLTMPISYVLAHCSGPVFIFFEKLQHERKEQYFQGNTALVSYRFNPNIFHS